MAEEKVLPKGIMAFNPHEKAPDWVIAQIIITPRELVDWLKGEGLQYLKESEKYGKQLKLSILKSKEGKLYPVVDTYEKPAPQNTSSSMSNDDLPF